MSFCVIACDDVVKFEGTLLLRHAGMEHDLQKEVAEFFAQVVEVVVADRVGDLVSLLERVRCDRRECLLEVPRTAGARRPQRGHDLDEPGNVA